MKNYDSHALIRLEKFVPTHCPNCAHSFAVNGDGGFRYDTGFLHPSKVAFKWISVFPEGAAHDGLQTDIVRCAKCRNTTLRVVTSVHTVATEEEALALEREGYVNRLWLTWHGVKPYDHPDYDLVIVPDPFGPRLVSFMPAGFADKSGLLRYLQRERTRI